MTENTTAKSDTRLMSLGFIIGLILISVFSFSALIGLSGYADDMRDKNNGQAHALSNSAIGFAGLKILLENMGEDVTLDPNEARYTDIDSLRIYTLNSAFQTDVLDELNTQSPKLIILPKWSVQPTPKAPGWVRKSPFSELQGESYLSSNLEVLVKDIKIIVADDKEETVAKDYTLSLSETDIQYTTRFPRLQTIKAETLIPIVTTSENEILLARIKDTQSYILSDPDVMNTAGLATKSGAEFALNVLYALGQETETYGFILDLAIHGIGGRQNMIKLFTHPPFLSVTLLILTLIALLGWQAFLRFGDPVKGTAEDFGEDFQMGPQSLARTTADFLAIAGRETRILQDYATLIYKQAQSDLNLTGRDSQSRGEALRKREIAKKIEPRFDTLNEEAKSVTQKQDMLRIAKALQKWKKDITA